MPLTDYAVISAHHDLLSVHTRPVFWVIHELWLGLITATLTRW